jgi:hypothetical protein
MQVLRHFFHSSNLHTHDSIGCVIPFFKMYHAWPVALRPQPCCNLSAVDVASVTEAVRLVFGKQVPQQADYHMAFPCCLQAAVASHTSTLF